MSLGICKGVKTYFGCSVHYLHLQALEFSHVTRNNEYSVRPIVTVYCVSFCCCMDIGY